VRSKVRRHEGGRGGGRLVVCARGMSIRPSICGCRRYMRMSANVGERGVEYSVRSTHAEVRSEALGSSTLRQWMLLGNFAMYTDGMRK
jgi:hypothetical protein